MAILDSNGPGTPTLCRHLRSLRAWLLAFVLAGSGPAFALQEVTDTLPSGAHIRVAVPEGWQAGDTLLLYQHGFNMEADLDPDLGPLRDLQLAQGYALAASGYSQSGWALFRAAADNRDLLNYVSTHFGTPGKLVIMGGSMGGLISLKLAELQGFERTAGVYSLCPAAAGARTWDTAFDLRLAYDTVCAGVGGGELLRGDEPLSFAMNLSDIPEDMGDLSGARSVQQTYTRIHQCTGLALPMWMRTPPQRDRLERLMRLGAFTSEDFLLYNLAYATFALSDLVRSPDKLGARNPFASRGVNYGDPVIDAGIARIDADALAAFDLHRASSLNGHIGAQVRIVSLHTDGDELVRPAHQQRIRQLYGSQAVSLPVDEAAGTHCGFSSAELVAGWRQLRRWMADPKGNGDLEGFTPACAQAMSDGFDGPCRFAPDLPVGELSTTMRERDPETKARADAASARLSGSWFDPERSGEGVLIERFNARQASVIWFTYAPSGEPEGLVWLGGVGEIEANGIHVETMRRMHGARFGAAFRPEDVNAEPWGTIDLAFDGADIVNHAPRLHLRYSGPGAYGAGLRGLQRALPVGPADGALSAEPARNWQYSGTWFDPERSGEGFFVQQSGAPFSRLTSVAWFTYDLDGQPLWLTAAATEQAGQVDLVLYRTAGTRFGEDFDASAITQTVFGHLRLNFTDCAHARLQFTAQDPRYGAYEQSLVRLTRPDIASGCVAP